MIKLISFDLQGTLSDSKYSNKFWIEYLPAIYGNPHKLKKYFQKIGVYHPHYYEEKYWEIKLNFDTKEVMKNDQPELNKEFINFIKNITLPKIILSTTTQTFINLELGKEKDLFNKCFSTIDDLQIAGKPKEAYLKIAEFYQLKPSQILHIGDNLEMDVINACQAGCKALHYQGDISQTITQIKEILNGTRNN